MTTISQSTYNPKEATSNGDSLRSTHSSTKSITTRDISNHRTTRYKRRLFYVVSTLLIIFMALSWISRTFQTWTGASLQASSVVVGDSKKPIHNDIVQIRNLDPALLPRPKQHGEHGRRLVIVGDVHGCRDELAALLEKVDFRPSLDHLILTGDLINKGPSSRGVIQLCQKLNASAVRGNHEDKMLRAHATLRSRDIETNPEEIDVSIEALARDFSDDEIAWIASRPLILSLGKIPGLPYKNTVIVHGGLVPGTPLEAQNPFFVMNMRSIDERTMQPQEKRDDGTKWWKVWNDAQESLPEGKRTLVVYGHDSKQGLVEKKYSIGLDTGCVKGGRLSALVIGPDSRNGLMKMEIESVKCRGYA